VVTERKSISELYTSVPCTPADIEALHLSLEAAGVDDGEIYELYKAGLARAKKIMED
jgi:hypothetical protein